LTSDQFDAVDDGLLRVDRQALDVLDERLSAVAVDRAAEHQHQRPLQLLAR